MEKEHESLDTLHTHTDTSFKEMINTITLGDSTKLLKNIPSESIDLIVTDCPYRIVNGGCSKGAYGNGKNQKQCGGMLKKSTKHINLGGIFDDEDYTTYAKQGKLFKHNDIDFSEWLPEVFRVLKQETHCYIMINARNLKELQQKAEQVGFKYLQLLVWKKNNATPNRYYLNNAEFILMLRKGRAKNINDMGTKNVIEINNIIGNKKHPTEKPVNLMKVFIRNSSNENDIVLDPFSGSGSTCIASKELNRRFIGIELDEKYHKISLERLNSKEKFEQMSF